MRTIKQLIDQVIKTEGGYVNHPNDKGGPTKYGITIETLEKWRGLPVSILDVQNLTKDEASEIYERDYFFKPGLTKLPEILQPLVFDMVVNHGQDRAIRMMQEVVQRMSGTAIAIDGKIGPATVAACNIAVNVYGVDVVRQIVASRKQFYNALVRRDPDQAVFLEGWLNRAEEFLT